MRGPVEYVRTVNYKDRTAATKKAVAEAEAKYDRDMADLERMSLTKPGKWRKVRNSSAHEKVCGGSPLRRELKAMNLEEVVVDGVADGRESKDDSPSPSSLGGILSHAENEGVLEESAKKQPERGGNGVTKPEFPRDRDGKVQMLDSGSELLCRCRTGYLCEYC
ncbi:hypothetical protein DOTSEDRAFT_26039 [Dothistroma septosporum NZE10]|uniref:Uncharacterized protein n=1 Tax=Dothistroma septosporum (strain NZE10 / CBS 128990) TaxID=675120 RepID=N1PLL2_DOTSN|nr:hypothetical protein DOTSEDRAFT_26039 [Dothistroma septosporum NZE10]